MLQNKFGGPAKHLGGHSYASGSDTSGGANITIVAAAANTAGIIVHNAWIYCASMTGTYGVFELKSTSQVMCGVAANAAGQGDNLGPIFIEPGEDFLVNVGGGTSTFYYYIEYEVL